MSEKKQVMVRFDVEDYEQLRSHAYQARVPVAVLARVLIKQRLDNLEFERGLLEEKAAVGVSSVVSPPGGSPVSRRRKKKRRK